MQFFFLAAVVIMIDQWSKYWIVHSLPFYASWQIIPNFLYLARTTNTGAAFGVLPHATLYLAVIAFAAAVGIIFAAFRSGWPLPILIGFGLALPLGGAVGNLVDRIRLGYVIDFIELHFGSYIWPNFNMADSAICVGVALLAISAMKSPVRSAGGTNKPGLIP